MVTCTFNKVHPDGTFSGKLVHPGGSGEWTASEQTETNDGKYVIIKYTNSAVHYSDAGSYSCEGTYEKTSQDDVVVIKSEMKTLTVNGLLCYC